MKIATLAGSIAAISAIAAWQLWKMASGCWEATPEGITASAECAVMLAIIDYHSDYGKMPEAKGEELFSILRGEDGNGENPSHAYYLKMPEGSLRDGETLDGWGKPLIVEMDHAAGSLRIKSSHEGSPEAFHSFKEKR